jgi:catechol 2,3-dioxygenase-like lactoylglutathione lyase family enzyme
MVVSGECKLSSNNSNDNDSKRTINIYVNDNNNDNESMNYRMSAMPHHVAIKVCNITNAINFYSLLGFTVETKFVTGPARAAWLIQDQQQQQYYYTEEEDEVNNNKHHQTIQVGFRIELIEVPSYMLQQHQQQQQRRHRAIDLMTHVTLLGLNHLALDITYNCVQRKQEQQQLELMGDAQQQQQYQLQEWIHDINTTSIKTYNKTIQYATPITALHITKRIIGKQVYEIAFIYDADGTIIELLYYCGDISPPLNSNNTTTAMADGWEPWDGIGFVQ